MTANEQLSRSEIIAGVINGNILAFEVLVRRYSPYLYKIGRSYNYNHQDTEDLMQESFIDAYKNLRKLRERNNLKMWLIRFMIKECNRAKHEGAFRRKVFHNHFKKKLVTSFQAQRYRKNN